MKAGTRVRLKVRTIFGWKGCGTVVRGYDPVRFLADGNSYDCDAPWRGMVDCTRDEVAVMRDQTPNPEHAGILADDKEAA
jgi:hypothetical protein